MQMAGKPSCPISKVMSVYGLVGRVTASERASFGPGFCPRDLTALDIKTEAPQIVFVPGHFARTHPKRLDVHAVLRSFVRPVPLFRIGASHHEIATADGNQVEVDMRCRRGLLVCFISLSVLGSPLLSAADVALPTEKTARTIAAQTCRPDARSLIST